MRQSYKKDYTWSKSGYAIVHHCEYNIFLPCSARRKHIPFQDPLSATLILPPSPFGPLALYSQITPKWEWRRVKVSRCKYLTSAPPPSIPGSAPANYSHFSISFTGGHHLVDIFSRRVSTKESECMLYCSGSLAWF